MSMIWVLFLLHLPRFLLLDLISDDNTYASPVSPLYPTLENNECFVAAFHHPKVTGPFVSHLRAGYAPRLDGCCFAFGTYWNRVVLPPSELNGKDDNFDYFTDPTKKLPLDCRTFGTYGKCPDPKYASQSTPMPVFSLLAVECATCGLPTKRPPLVLRTAIAPSLGCAANSDRPRVALTARIADSPTTRGSDATSSQTTPTITTTAPPTTISPRRIW